MQVGTPVVQYNVHAHWTKSSDAGAALFWTIRAIVWLATILIVVHKLRNERHVVRTRVVFVMSSSLSISTHFVASVLNVIWGVQQCKSSAFATWFIQQTVVGQLVPMAVYMVAFKYTRIIPTSNVRIGWCIICFSVAYLPLFGGGCYVGSVTSVIASLIMITTNKKHAVDARNDAVFRPPTAASNSAFPMERLAATVQYP
jgi:hypothetical protein